MFQKRRELIYQRSRRHFPVPVAWLLAVAYEPRADDETLVPDFNHQVEFHQRELREKMHQFSRGQGGKAEAIALEVAHNLKVEAERHTLTLSVSILDAAIDRCAEVRGPDSGETVDPINVARVPDYSGNPIGLWR